MNDPEVALGRGILCLLALVVLCITFTVNKTNNLEYKCEKIEKLNAEKR